MRIQSSLAALLAVTVLAGCTKEQVFSEPYSGTIIELGFAWNESISFCIDSDDHPDILCVSASFLDGERLQVNVMSDGVSWIEGEEGVPKMKVKSEVLRYVYNPAMHTMTLYLTGGEVELAWSNGSGCFRGDILHDDVLRICP